MIGIGHIGAGDMARARAAELQKEKDVRLLVGWSRGEANRRQYERLTGGRAVEDWRAVIDHPDVQAVCIATPTATHARYALCALEAAKHVLLECPAAANVADLDRMQQAAERSGLVLYVGSNYRFDAAARALAWAAERVGRVLLAQGDSSWCPPSPWYFERAMSGGVFCCVHLYQMRLFHCLGRATGVTAHFGATEHYGVAMVKYESGALAVATGGLHRFGTNEFSMVGSEGMLCRQPDGTWVLRRTIGTEAFPVGDVHATREDNAAFLRCLRGEEDWRIHARQEREVHALAIAAQQSAEQGRCVIL